MPCCKFEDAKFNPDDKSWSALIRRINLSALLQCSGAWGWETCCVVGDSPAPISADNGAHLISATSRIQSVNANTKFSLAKVSL